MRDTGARLAAFSSGRGERRQGFDLPFLLLVLLLLTIGVVAVLSASYPRAYYDPSHVTGGRPAYYFVRQLLFALLGVGAMLLASRLPMAFYRRMAFPFLGLTVLLLALVPLIGVRANGARRWLGVGGLTLQPSELAKLAVILSFAALICRFRGGMRSFRRGILPFAGILALLIGLLVREPHFSASVILSAIAGAMLFLGGVPLGWFAAAFAAAGAGIGVLLTFFPYASSRIVTWRDPFSSPSDEGYQIVQSLYTIGSGGLSGLGLGGSRQKFLYLPEEHNDFIFSVVCEELGFLGASLLLALFALLLPGLRGDHDPARAADLPQRGGGDESPALHRHLPALFQLRRDGPADPVGRDGDRPQRLARYPDRKIERIKSHEVRSDLRRHRGTHQSRPGGGRASEGAAARQRVPVPRRGGQDGDGARAACGL